MATGRFPKNKKQRRAYRMWMARNVGHAVATARSKKGIAPIFPPRLNG